MSQNKKFGSIKFAPFTLKRSNNLYENEIRENELRCNEIKSNNEGYTDKLSYNEIKGNDGVFANELSDNEIKGYNGLFANNRANNSKNDRLNPNGICTDNLVHKCNVYANDSLDREINSKSYVYRQCSKEQRNVYNNKYRELIMNGKNKTNCNKEIKRYERDTNESKYERDTSLYERDVIRSDMERGHGLRSDLEMNAMYRDMSRKSELKRYLPQRNNLSNRQEKAMINNRQKRRMIQSKEFTERSESNVNHTISDKREKRNEVCYSQLQGSESNVNDTISDNKQKRNEVCYSQLQRSESCYDISNNSNVSNVILDYANYTFDKSNYEKVLFTEIESVSKSDSIINDFISYQNLEGPKKRTNTANLLSNHKRCEEQKIDQNVNIQTKSMKNEKRNSTTEDEKTEVNKEDRNEKGIEDDTNEDRVDEPWSKEDANERAANERWSKEDINESKVNVRWSKEDIHVHVVKDKCLNEDLITNVKWTKEDERIKNVRWSKEDASEIRVTKGPWSKEEDRKLVMLIKKYGPKNWSKIAENIKTRIGKQCRERWHNHLHPNIKKTPFTSEEDKIIIRLHDKFGNRWSEISKFLPGRTDNAIKNHWNSALQKRLKKRSFSTESMVCIKKFDDRCCCSECSNEKEKLMMKRCMSVSEQRNYENRDDKGSVMDSQVNGVKRSVPQSAFYGRQVVGPYRVGNRVVRNEQDKKENEPEFQEIAMSEKYNVIKEFEKMSEDEKAASIALLKLFNCM